ncbi:MAG: TetR/AcrR family transcriptional regulator [Nitrospirota bacterium]
MDTREKIMDAALMLFSKKGYIGATTREIAGNAGVAEVTLFRHFSSKEKLFEEVINTYSFLPALKGLLPSLKNMDYTDALSELAGRFLERLSERKELIRIMHAEIHIYPAKVREIYHNFIDELFRTLASYFRELQLKKVLRDFSPEIGAGAFLGMFFSYFNSKELLLRKDIAAMDSAAVINEFVNIFTRGTLK